jgi:hypothetical protein
VKRFLRTALAFVIGVGIMAVFVLSRQLGDESGGRRRPDLQDYCRTEHGPEARTFLSRPDEFGWQCITPRDAEPDVAPVNAQLVCQSQFGPSYMAEYDDDGWPFAWHCVDG